jgi:prepilin-type N-terminal cleavage/methylation domain-containing protein
MTINTTPRLRRDSRGFSLVELLVTMAITLVIMGATMAALGDAWKASESASLITTLNGGVRVAMDLVVRDLLQVGQGLPTGRNITIPSGGTAVMLPGPPGEPNYTLPITTTVFSAVIPGPNRGGRVAGQTTNTDMITTFAADSSFEGRALTALADNSMTVALPPVFNGANISDGGVNSADDIDTGNLIMLTKGALSAIVEVTSVVGQVINFAAGDALNLNQAWTVNGSVGAYRRSAPGLNAAVPPVESQTAGLLPSTATRIRMVTYYIDAATEPLRPRLVRRMNNRVCSGIPPPVGCNAATFDNTRGTVVAFDVENLTFSYDMADGANDPAGVRMITPVDFTTAGACTPIACAPGRIRKVNVLLAARARRPMRATRQLFRTSLFSQVSLRSLAFVDNYQ